ncbi:MAG: TrkH family potassium uptake protein [Chlorobiales bacterium]
METTNQSKRSSTAQVAATWIETHRLTILRTIDNCLIILALLAITAIIARVGFHLDNSLEAITQLTETVMLYCFAIQAFIKVALAENKRRHVRERWLELILFAVILFYLIFPHAIEQLLSSLNPQLTPETLTSVYLILTQFLVVVALLPATLRYSGSLMTTSVQPSGVLLFSFVLLSLLGTGFLLLPKVRVQELSVIDALFIATSAVCVTGLATVNIATAFTDVGHWIILILIQIGGLGIMTLTTFFAMATGSSRNLKEYTALRELLGEESLGKVKTILFQIGFYTFLIEGLGALLIYHTLTPSHLPKGTTPFFFSLFHSISAFCNAGFSLLSENLSNIYFYKHTPFLCIIIVLLVIGGLGFPVLSSFSTWVMGKILRKPNVRLTIHARIVLIASGVLLVVGTVGFWILEGGRNLYPFTAFEQFTQALFHSAVSRTAGFNTLDIASFSTATLFFTIILMWIGASPSSTGGGIKTTTATLALLNIYAIASGRNKIELFHRKISDLAITRAFSTALLSLLYIATALFVLLITEQARGFSFEALLFEVVSAVSTVGLSTGVTPQLSDAGKVVVIFSMLIGRVGFLTVVIALTRKRADANYDYAEESVLVS